MAEGYKDWAAGDILTAADLEDYTVKQSVMRFADSSARTTALSGVLAEGMVSYLKDTDSVEVYDGSAWAAIAGGKILQVVSTNKTDTFSTTSTSYTDITGLSVSITPTSATSKILVLFSVNTGASAANSNAFVLLRDSTEISIGAAAGSREQATVVNTVTAANFRMSAHHVFLDSPATTSATTYKVQAMSQGATLTVNYASGDTDTGGAVYARSTSNITVMEVAA